MVTFVDRIVFALGVSILDLRFGRLNLVVALGGSCYRPLVGVPMYGEFCSCSLVFLGGRHVRHSTGGAEVGGVVVGQVGSSIAWV